MHLELTLSWFAKTFPNHKQTRVLLKVEACGVCHGDAIAKEGSFPGLRYPRVPGHEVVGVIDRLGSPSQDWKVGQRVGVGDTAFTATPAVKESSEHANGG